MIHLDNITIIAGQFALRDVSMQIEAGKYAVLMGQTGMGKTTILEAICGLRKVTSGRILIHGTDITDWQPAERQIGYVPQDLALFPTMTVKQHLEFALRLRKVPAFEIAQRIESLADLLRLGPLMHRGVQGLSGGESQRVALGRALSFRPPLLLLDEPLSALDEATRNEMHVLLRDITDTTHVTTLHVTHSNEEADTLADVRFVLKSGQVQRVDSTSDNEMSTGNDNDVVASS